VQELQRQTSNSKLYMIYRSAPFSMTLNDPWPRFHDHGVCVSSWHVIWLQ